MKSFSDFLNESKTTPVRSGLDEGIHSDLGMRGLYDITDVGIPRKGEAIDYYDRKGEKRYGKVKSVNAKNVMTLTDVSTGETVKLTLIRV